MHLSPAKHSYAWLPRKCDYQTDTQTDRQTLDKVIPTCMYRYASQATQKAVLHLPCFFTRYRIKDTCVVWWSARAGVPDKRKVSLGLPSLGRCPSTLIMTKHLKISSYWFCPISPFTVINFNLCYHLLTVRDIGFLFGMHSPLMMPFRDFLRARTNVRAATIIVLVSKNITLAITQIPQEVRLSYFKCVFLVTRHFTWYHYSLPCDLAVWPTFEKLEHWP